MFVLTQPIALAGKKIITDLALRSGSATVQSYSPYQGLIGLKQYYLNISEPLNVAYSLEHQADFNADVRKPYLTAEELEEDEDNPDFLDIGTTTFNVYTDTYEDFKLYYRRLEDIAIDYVRNYLGNVFYSIKHMSGCAEGLLQFNAKHPMQLNYTMNDDDDVVEIADLVSVENNLTDISEKLKALQNLPYVLKRLHSLSAYSGVSVLSCIQAYEKARQYFAKYKAGSTRKIKHNDLIEQGVWLVDKRGNAYKQVTVSQKNKKAQGICDWVLGMSTANPSFLEDLHNFNNYCKILNIDLVHDDITRYDYDFIMMLQCTKLTPNYQYQREIYKSILDDSVEDQMQDDLTYEVMHKFDTLINYNTAFENISNISSENYDNITACNHRLAYCIGAMCGIMYDVNKFYYSSGFLYYEGEPVVLPTRYIAKNTEVIYYRNMVFHELGFCIALTKSAKLYAIPSLSAMNNFSLIVAEKDNYAYDYIKWVLYQ